MRAEKQEYMMEHTEAVKAAMREWKDAIVYFENINDPELIDYAAYCIETARRKYEYLLKRGG